MDKNKVKIFIATHKKFINRTNSSYIPLYVGKSMARDYGYYFNMFISNKELTNQYCEWLYSIIFELEGIIDISNYDSYQQRVFGFLSERLMNVWVEHNNLKIKEFPVRDLGKFNFIKFHLGISIIK